MRIVQAVVVLLLATTIPMVAQLPPEILVDRYLFQAEQRQDQGNHYGALESLQKVLDLQKEHGLSLPEEFHYQHAQVAFSAGKFQAALDAVKEYLKLAGRAGEHYRAALGLLDSADEKLQEIEAERKRIEAERKRAEALDKENSDQAKRQITAAGVRLARDPMKSGGRAPQMVTIASGRFQYYTSTSRVKSGRLLQWVTFDKPFAIGKYEVTRGEFERFIDQTRYRTEAERDPKYGCNDPSTSERRKNSSLRWKRPGFEQTDTHPVACVSTRDAIAYAEWLSLETGQTYRLPSAAEWQYAARAGSNAAMLFVESDDESDVCKRGNVFDSSAGDHSAVKCSDGAIRTAEVGRFMPNDVGLYDMIGNVSELVLACAHIDFKGALDLPHFRLAPDGLPESPESCGRYVVALGGDWFTNPTSYLDSRLWSRIYAKPFREKSAIVDGWYYYRRTSTTWAGFRIVKDLPDDPTPK